MATRLPPLDDVAPSPALESSSSMAHDLPLHSHAAPTTATTPTAPATATTCIDPDGVKLEASPTPSGRNSADAETETPGASDHAGGPAGRKRKLNSASARGVANLTADQLAKKRANDRQAQRAIRERTKSHIDLLEQRVRDLSSQKPFLDLQSALKQNEAIQAENRDIRQSLKAVVDIIQPLVGGGRNDASNHPPPAAVPPAGPKSAPPPLSTTSPFSENNNPFGAHLQRPATLEHTYSDSIASVDTPSSTHSAPTLGTSRRGSATGTPASSFRLAFDYQRHNLLHGLDFGTDERMAFDFLLDASQQVPRVEGFRRSAESTRPPQLNSSACVYAQPGGEQPLPAYLAPIRNVQPTCALDTILLDFLHNRQREAAQGVPKQKLVGPPYPSVSSLLNPEKSVNSHPLSRVFTDILRTFPDISSLPEQVGVLYLMFLLMRWQIYQTPENFDRMPEWMVPRPSQILHPHPAWMDYLPWPKMRDRVCMSHHEYPFENWFIPFTRTLSVNWPYEATDCLLSTGEGEELVINPVFERHLSNLNNWSLGPAFAEAYPALVETTTIRGP